MVGAKVVCLVCSEHESKYKCPACCARYCSLACYKKHKESQQCSTTNTTTITDNNSSNSNKEASTAKAQQSHEDEMFMKKQTSDFLNTMDEEDKVADEVLSKVWESTTIQSMLNNNELVDIMKGLDSSYRPHDYFQKLGAFPIFREFAEECLSVIESNVPNKEQGTML